MQNSGLFPKVGYLSLYPEIEMWFNDVNILMLLHTLHLNLGGSWQPGHRQPGPIFSKLFPHGCQKNAGSNSDSVVRLCLLFQLSSKTKRTKYKIKTNVAGKASCSAAKLICTVLNSSQIIILSLTGGLNVLLICWEKKKMKENKCQKAFFHKK